MQMLTRIFSSVFFLAAIGVATWSSCNRGDGKEDSSDKKAAEAGDDDVTDDSGAVSCDAVCMNVTTLVNIGKLPADAMLPTALIPRHATVSANDCRSANTMASTVVVPFFIWWYDSITIRTVLTYYCRATTSGDILISM